ncbi:MAG: ABC transporter permease subunit [Pseudomonadales bacterium]|nr:ABC transporter permease subunit [Pseudomonadales bacterium]NIX08024.1 ABC transporter permease subunit [Pseudomonadales bacterium]
MRPDVVKRIAGKELTLFFASPVGYLFLGAFLAFTLFVFFWVEAFFARNVADVRPMFEWMPVLLVFLSAALTMRMWSEERRTGTLEFVATVPVSGWEFVVGKFLACWVLLAIALLLTLPLPLSVSLIADLDWGPVWAGYLAAMLLGGAYLAIGLFVSARTDSQIVSLILASFACGAVYLIGSPVLTDLVGGGLADVLRSIGSGSRFESITRGVLDLRDLYYYASLLAVFLAANVHALEVQRWAADGASGRHRRWLLGTGLLVANLLLANVWLAQLTSLRIDVTEGRIYSVSDATRAYIGQLREPLLIRGYFSNRTHPLLAPLVPRMRDLLNEFEVAGAGRIRVEIIDPADDPAAEDEANSKYGIRPVPFQVADRYEASLVNSYFDVLLSYGDEYEVLGFRDLIEVKVVGEADLDVQLRNPEFDLTRSIKKILYGFQGGGSIFANVQEPVRFVGYVSSADRLPPALADYRAVLMEVLDGLSQESGGLFTAEFIDPEAGDGSVAAQIAVDYGFQPMAASLFDANVFYFYLTLGDGKTLIQLPLPEAFSSDATRRVLEEGLKRFASGMLRTVALAAPEAPPYMGMGQPPQGNQYEQLKDVLRSDFQVETTDLTDGLVPDSADLLMIVDPEGFDTRQRFAVDQFLMKGGTVVVATAPFSASLSQQSLMAAPRTSGLEAWLAHMGVTIKPKLVMDAQNAAFPAPVTRQVGGFSFQELVMLDYPYFVDVRGEGMNAESAIVAGLPQVTLTWTSPIEIDAEQDGRTVTELLKSSPRSWLSADTNVMPRIDEQGLSGFAPEGEQAPRLLGAVIEGRFGSFFAGQKSPLLEPADADDEEDAAAEGDEAGPAATVGVVSSVIDRSAESARLFVFSSDGFLADQNLRMLGSAEGTIYTNTVQMMVNVVDWSLEDQSLLSIRSRGHFNRTLPPLLDEEQLVWEYLNYALALLGIGVVFAIHRGRKRKADRTYAGWLAGGGS